MRMRPVGPLVPWETARARLVDSAEPPRRTERLALTEAVGRVAAREVRAARPVPPFDRATWDGYALRSVDSIAATSARARELRVVGEVFAEGGYRRPIRSGECVAIATGGALPPGADAVIRFEDVTLRHGRIAVRQRVGPGERLAARGEDVARSAVVVASGRTLAPADLGALALTGARAVEVWSRPVVTILPNGNELVAPGGRLVRGRIYEGNNATLAALVEAAGGVARPLAPVPDDPQRIEAAVRRALRTSDLVVVTGGSSVGERDHLPRIFPNLGRMLFRGIAIRPGRPTLAVRVGRKVVLGMPGHPTSCLSNGLWLLLPLLRSLAHRSASEEQATWVRLSASPGLPPSELATVIPLALQGSRARPTFHDSSAISSLGGANAYAIWPAGRPLPERGDRLLAYRLPPPIGSDPTASPPTGEPTKGGGGRLH